MRLNITVRMFKATLGRCCYCCDAWRWWPVLWRAVRLNIAVRICDCGHCCYAVQLRLLIECAM